MFKNLVRSVIYELWPELSRMLKSDVLVELLRELQTMYVLDPKSQYMIVVKDDETAQQLVTEINRRFTPDTRIIVMAAENVKVVEITKRR